MLLQIFYTLNSKQVKKIHEFSLPVYPHRQGQTRFFLIVFMPNFHNYKKTTYLCLILFIIKYIESIDPTGACRKPFPK